MRIVCGAVLAASLFVTLTAAFAEPLPPGYPAGVYAARGRSPNTAVMIGIGAAIMTGVGILISGDSSTVDTLQISSQPIVVAPPVSSVVSTATTS